MRLTTKHYWKLIIEFEFGRSLVGIVHVKDPTSIENLAGEILRTQGANLTEGIHVAKKRKGNVSALPKETIDGKSDEVAVVPENIKALILNELLELEAKEELGATFLLLEQGMRIGEVVNFLFYRLSPLR